MNWSDKALLQNLLDKPRAFRYFLPMPGAPLQKKMVILSSDYPMQYSNQRCDKFETNRKKY